MNPVFELIKKNMKNLIRSKTSSLIVIAGPLLVILLAGLAFDNSNAYAVKVGSFAQKPNDVTKAFIEELELKFKVTEYRSEIECTRAVKTGEVNTCMVFAEDFAVGVPPRNQILFHVDYSRMNLVWAVMRAMTETVGDASIDASENLTHTLISALEFTQGEIDNERRLLVALTTENELLSKNTQDVIVQLSDLDLGIDDSYFSSEEVMSARTQVKQWSENAVSLGAKGLSKAVSFIDAADALVKQSSASTETKNALLASFEQSVADIEQLEDDFGATENLTNEAFEKFDAQITKIANGLVETKSNLAKANTERELSLRVLETMSVLLDKSLITILTVQKSLNDIDARINSIEITDPAAIAQPIVTKVKPVVQEKTHLNYLFPVIIVLVIMFTGLLVTPTLILLEKNSHASFRNYMLPVSEKMYVLSAFLTSMLLLVIQGVVILVVVGLFFGGVGNVVKASVLLLLVSSVFVLIGMVIGYALKTEETATFASVSVGSILLLISDVIVPLESMPEAFAYIASFNPYVIGSSLMRKALLFNSPVSQLILDSLILIGYGVALSFAALGVYLLTRKYSLQQLLKKVKPIISFNKLKSKFHIK